MKLPQRYTIGISRRTALRRVGVSLLGILLGCERGKARPRQIDLGSLADIPIGRSTYETQRLSILRGNNTIQAFSLVCPHQGCAVSPSDSGYVCGCHGARFDTTGELKRGPARRGLTAYRVMISADDTLVVDVDSEVERSWKLQLPR